MREQFRYVLEHLRQSGTRESLVYAVHRTCSTLHQIVGDDQIISQQSLRVQTARGRRQ